MTFPRYHRYKSSGSPWLGSVPEHWRVTHLRHIGRFLKGSGGSKDDIVDVGVPCVRYGDLYTTHSFFITDARTRVTELAASAYTPIQHGDVLFAASGETYEEIGKSAVNLIPGPACCGGDVIILRPSISLDACFLGYAADCSNSAAQKASLGRGTTVKHIYPDQLKQLLLTVPPRSEQASIAAFVDRETGRIDSLVADLQRLIELLKEKRQAVIAHAVTKGLDPDVPMKPSGVEWLGSVPQHWEMKPLKRVARLITERVSARTNPVALEDIEKWTGRLVPTDAGYEGEGVGFEAGDVLFGKLRPYLAKVHLAQAPGQAMGDFLVLRPQGTSGALLQYQMLNRAFIDIVDGSTFGSKMPRASWDVVGGLLLPCPPPGEQRAVCEFLRLELGGYDAISADARKALGLLDERRAALISAAVTGQIDVRNAVATEAA